jgi:acetolactate synthase I/II/III large subunit
MRQNWTGVYRGHGTLHYRGYSDRLRLVAKGSRLDEEKCTAFFGLLARSRRPLLYAGGGIIASGASAELGQFAERYRIPVVTTLMGSGSLRARHELNLVYRGVAERFVNSNIRDSVSDIAPVRCLTAPSSTHARYAAPTPFRR